MTSIKKVCVIGLGYIGLPTAAIAAQQDDSSVFEKLLFGIILGLLAYALVLKRKIIIDALTKFITSKGPTIPH